MKTEKEKRRPRKKSDVFAITSWLAPQAVAMCGADTERRKQMIGAVRAQHAREMARMAELIGETLKFDELQTVTSWSADAGWTVVTEFKPSWTTEGRIP